jgi:hypothetical protein
MLINAESLEAVLSDKKYKKIKLSIYDSDPTYEMIKNKGRIIFNYVNDDNTQEVKREKIEQSLFFTPKQFIEINGEKYRVSNDKVSVGTKFLFKSEYLSLVNDGILSGLFVIYPRIYQLDFLLKKSSFSNTTILSFRTKPIILQIDSKNIIELTPQRGNAHYRINSTNMKYSLKK